MSTSQRRDEVTALPVCPADRALLLAALEHLAASTDKPLVRALLMPGPGHQLLNSGGRRLSPWPHAASAVDVQFLLMALQPLADLRVVLDLGAGLVEEERPVAPGAHLRLVGDGGAGLAGGGAVLVAAASRRRGRARSAACWLFSPLDLGVDLP